MTRLQAGALGVHARPVATADIISRALDSLGDQRSRIRVRLPTGLPALLTDPALLERVLANLLGNAIRYSPPGQQVLLTASSHHDQVELRVADRGPGIPPADRDRVFQPFQSLGGQDDHPGPGLGLALARGLTEAMNGTLTPDDTPGGGLTMVLALPAASPAMARAGTDGGAHADR
jgi:two-component system sensor histidine kinase KdpD